MVFQEPMSSLNPAFTIGEQIAEVLLRHRRIDRKTAQRRAIEMLEQVRMPSPERRYHDYPHRLSGGMRQRAMIAMALACEPKLLIADEPTTALDVTIQAQILDLLDALRQEHEMAMILITHDMGVVAELADEVAVMYAGRIVGRARGAALRRAAASLYDRAAGLDPEAARATDAPHLDRGPAADDLRCGGRLPFRAALPVRRGALRAGRSGPFKNSPGSRSGLLAGAAVTLVKAEGLVKHFAASEGHGARRRRRRASSSPPAKRSRWWRVGLRPSRPSAGWCCASSSLPPARSCSRARTRQRLIPGARGGVRCRSFFRTPTARSIRA